MTVDPAQTIAFLRRREADRQRMLDQRFQAAWGGVPRNRGDDHRRVRAAPHLAVGFPAPSTAILRTVRHRYCAGRTGRRRAPVPGLCARRGAVDIPAGYRGAGTYRARIRAPDPHHGPAGPWRPANRSSRRWPPSSTRHCRCSNRINRFYDEYQEQRSECAPVHRGRDHRQRRVRVVLYLRGDGVPADQPALRERARQQPVGTNSFCVP